jgi:excinuclease UvrABC nuclease subunit
MTEKVELGVLPAVQFEARDNLPRISAIYFALANNDKALYIGAAIDLWRRWRSHHHIRALRAAGCAKIAWQSCSRDEIVALEGVMIERFDPPFNGAWRPMVLRLPKTEKEKVFSLRIAPETDQLVDSTIKNHKPRISKNSWIMEAILQKLESSGRA